jgi:hypothetical protein
MAQTLAQSALLSENDLQRGVLETFVQTSVVLDRIPFMDINGNAFAYNEELALSAVEFRAVNAAYTESTGTVAQSTESLVILGGDADVDRFIVQTRGNLNDQRAVQTNMKTKALTYKFQDTFINGSTGVDANSFNGLKTRITGGQVIAAGTNGLGVLGADDAARQSFLDVLDAGIAAVPGINGGNGAIYVNANIMSKLRSSMRRLNLYNEVVQTLTADMQRNVLTYAGIPVLDIGNKTDGSLILPQTETQGASSVTSSIYIVKFGEDETDRGVTGLTNGGVQVFDLGMLETKSVYRTRVEFFCGLGVFGPKAAARITGVLNS